VYPIAVAIRLSIMQASLILCAAQMRCYRLRNQHLTIRLLGLKELERFQRVLVAEYPDMLFSMEDLASSYKMQRRWKEAGELFVSKQLRATQALCKHRYFHRSKQIVRCGHS